MISAMRSSLAPLLPLQHSTNQPLDYDFEQQVQVYLKREDLLHPAGNNLLSGNKYRKLNYNLAQARQDCQSTLLTFGGAYSNHIAAVAAAGAEFGFSTIGIIRGDELINRWHHNPTLQQAHQQGMRFKFVSRAAYRTKQRFDFIAQLHQEFGDFYLIPEGGSNQLAILGCTDILTDIDRQQFDIICCAVGTGGTLAGLIEASSSHQRVLGFATLKGNFLGRDIGQWTHKTNWQMIDNYHCGGYAKTTPQLLKFIDDFEQHTHISIEPVYTGKMLYGLFDLIKQGYFPAHSRILAIHTGGLQGRIEPEYY